MRVVMVDMKHLRKVRGKWEVRVAVPAPLIPTIGQGTLTYNTRTDDVGAAIAIREVKVREFRNQIEEARNGNRRYTHIEDPVFPTWGGGGMKKSPQTARFVAGVPVPMNFDLVAHLRRTVRMDAPVVPVVDYETIITDWAREVEKTDRDPAVTAKRTAMRRFFDWLKAGHTDMARIETADLQRYKEYWLKRLNDPNDNGVRKSKTVEDQLYQVKGLFTFAFDNNKFQGQPNPGAGVHYKGKTDSRDKYQDFTADEIRTVLTEARKAEPFIRWFHWLAAYSGARLAEVCEAQTQDVEIFGDGSAVFHIRLLNRPEKQRLKNDFSERPVPIHRAVLAEGFLSYVEWIRREYHGGGDGPLFPMLKLHLGRLHKDASNRSLAWLREIGIGVNPDGSHDRRKCNHSWRHTAKSQFRHYMDEQFSDKLTGHSDGREGREYGRFPIPLLRQKIEAIEPWEI